MLQGYNPANIPDRVKHENLSTLVRAIKPEAYIELHSGAGFYNGYPGSAIQVLGILDGVRAFLHEINIGRRKQLAANVRAYPNAAVRGDWHTDIADYIACSDDTYLFMMDPTKVTDYQGDLIDTYIPQILAKGSPLFMYIPQTIRFPKHKDIVEAIYAAISESSREGIDMMHPAKHGGSHARVNHNIVVADTSLDELAEHHEQIFRQYLKFKTFAEFRERWRKV